MKRWSKKVLDACTKMVQGYGKLIADTRGQREKWRGYGDPCLLCRVVKEDCSACPINPCSSGPRDPDVKVDSEAASTYEDFLIVTGKHYRGHPDTIRDSAKCRLRWIKTKLRSNGIAIKGDVCTNREKQ